MCSAIPSTFSEGNSETMYWARLEELSVQNAHQVMALLKHVCEVENSELLAIIAKPHFISNKKSNCTIT